MYLGTFGEYFMKVFYFHVFIWQKKEEKRTQVGGGGKLYTVLWVFWEHRMMVCKNQSIYPNRRTQNTLTITGKMMARNVDLRIQRTARHTIWTRVKRWTRLIGTWRRKEKSGWCFGGIRYSLMRSQNWNKEKKKIFSGILLFSGLELKQGLHQSSKFGKKVSHSSS